MWNDRAITVGGVLFVLLTLPGYFLLSGGIAAGDGTTEEAAEWLGDSGHRAQAIAGGYAMCAGALAFLLLAQGIVERARSAGGPMLVVGLIQTTGLAFAVCQAISAVAMMAPAIAVVAGNESTPLDPDAVRITTFGAELWLVPGMLCASAFVLSTAAAIFSSSLLPTWIGLAALLCAAVLLAGIVFVPVVLLMLWVLTVSFVVMARPMAVGQTHPMAGSG